MGGIDWGTVADALAAVFIVCGTFLAFVAGVGVFRLPDLLSRMHAATKPQVLGLMLVLLGVALRLQDWSVTGTLFLVVIFQLLTSPVAAHMVGRAGYRTGKIATEDLVVDELTADQDHAEAEAQDVMPTSPENAAPQDSQAAARAREHGTGSPGADEAPRGS